MTYNEFIRNHGNILLVNITEIGYNPRIFGSQYWRGGQWRYMLRNAVTGKTFSGYISLGTDFDTITPDTRLILSVVRMDYIPYEDFEFEDWVRYYNFNMDTVEGRIKARTAYANVERLAVNFVSIFGDNCYLDLLNTNFGE